MEGAVASGMQAAEAVRLKTTLGGPVKMLIPETRPRWLMLFLKWALLPGALLALFYAWVTRRGES
jgi:hypothetical protein